MSYFRFNKSETFDYIKMKYNKLQIDSYFWNCWDICTFKWQYDFFLTTFIYLYINLNIPLFYTILVMSLYRTYAHCDSYFLSWINKTLESTLSRALYQRDRYKPRSTATWNRNEGIELERKQRWIQIVSRLNFLLKYSGKCQGTFEMFAETSWCIFNATGRGVQNVPSIADINAETICFHKLHPFTILVVQGFWDSKLKHQFFSAFVNILFNET